MSRWQEARALRYAPAAARAVRLLGAFSHGGHVCLVLERLVPCLLDYVVDSVGLALAARLANLRELALQLLVRPGADAERELVKHLRVFNWRRPHGWPTCADWRCSCWHAGGDLEQE